MSDKQLILKIGAEGGSITLFGIHSERGWLYSTSVSDWTPELIDEESIRYDSHVIASWEAVLQLLDRYPWHLLVPLKIHPEFRQQIWAAVQTRFAGRAGSSADIERWRELCGEPHDPS
jgi:hypothetical protein